MAEREVRRSWCLPLRARNLTAAFACPSFASKASEWSAGISARKARAARSSTGSRLARIAGKDAGAPSTRSFFAKTPALQHDATRAIQVTKAGRRGRIRLRDCFISSAIISVRSPTVREGRLRSGPLPHGRTSDTCEAYSLRQKGSSVIETKQFLSSTARSFIRDCPPVLP